MSSRHQSPRHRKPPASADPAAPKLPAHSNSPKGGSAPGNSGPAPGNASSTNSAPPASSTTTSPGSTPGGNTAELSRKVLCWACGQWVQHRLWSCPENKPANAQKILQNFRKWWGDNYSAPPANSLSVPKSVEELQALQASGTRRQGK